jgi:hypothetical protein
MCCIHCTAAQFMYRTYMAYVSDRCPSMHVSILSRPGRFYFYLLLRTYLSWSLLLLFTPHQQLNFTCQFIIHVDRPQECACLSRIKDICMYIAARTLNDYICVLYMYPFNFHENDQFVNWTRRC